jgi:hypothetical protein
MAKSRSPFLDNSLLQQEIDDFLTRFRATFAQQVQRTSAFFEIACYNDLVRYYEAMHFEVTPHNTMPRSKQFVYALSTNAKPENCSYFVAKRTYPTIGVMAFEIRHNLRIQSAHDDGVFVSPDYAVINPGTLTSRRDPDYYNGKVEYDFVPAAEVQTFAETKHYTPSPELILNFVGLVNELLPNLMRGDVPSSAPKHLGPSLFISGAGNSHHDRIRASLAKRYSINIFLGLFARRTQVYAASNQRNLVKIGTR